MYRTWITANAMQPATSSPAAVPARIPGYGEIARFSGPLMLGLLTNALHTVIDSLFAARLGTAALAAVGFAATAYFAALVMFLGLMRNSIAFVARAHGEARQAGIGLVVAQYQWLALLAFPLVYVALLAFPWIAAVARLTPEVEALAASFLWVRVWDVPLVLTAVLYGAMFQATGRSVPPMAVAWAGLVLNTVLNYALVLGNWGFPALGVAGSALATVIAQGAGMAALVSWAHLGEERRRFSLRLWMRPRPTLLASILAVGIPQGLGDAVEVLSFLAFFAIIARLGEISLAASNIAVVVTHMLFLPGFAMGIAGASYVGRLLGAGRPDLARRTVRRVLFLGVLYMGLLGLPLWGWGGAIGEAYSSDVEIVRLATLIFKVMALYQVCDAAGIILRISLSGAGDTWRPTAILAACAGLVLLPGAWWLSRVIEPGVVGGWIGAFGYMALLAVLLLWRFERGAWERTRIIPAGD
jgi:MATE family multidrug resistance protein